jgi:DNA-binding NtrC family response regulator
MNGRILIADKDARYRSRMAGYFQKAGYRVTATGSADEALDSILEKESSVILLGSNLTESSALADLVKLINVFDDQLRVILVSADMSLAQTREVRDAGIFYHALKPAAADDTDELRQAVTCAFEDLVERAPSAQLQPDLARASVTPVLARMPLGKALSWIAAIVALSFGAGALALQSKPAQSSSLTIWIFLGFLALIITNQLLPIFRVKLVLESLRQWKTARSAAHRGGR